MIDNIVDIDGDPGFSDINTHDLRPKIQSLVLVRWSSVENRVRPSKTGSSASLYWVNFSNRTIIKGDTATLVKQGQEYVLCKGFWWMWTGKFRSGRALIKSSLSCGRAGVLMSFQHWDDGYFRTWLINGQWLFMEINGDQKSSINPHGN